MPGGYYRSGEGKTLQCEECARRKREGHVKTLWLVQRLGAYRGNKPRRLGKKLLVCTMHYRLLAWHDVLYLAKVEVVESFKWKRGENYPGLGWS